MKRYVIYSPDLGVYLSPMEGIKGFTTLWTRPADDNEIAATFASPEQAAKEIASWPGPPPQNWRAVEVEADGAGRATLAACVVAGLPPAEGEEGEGLDNAVTFTPGGEGERGAGWADAATVLDGGR